MNQVKISPAEGRLGILVVGCGAVATTFITGVLMARKGLAKPIGSMTQYDRIRVGSGDARQYLKYEEIVPLARLSDLVFGCWDVYPQNAYQAAMYAEVLKASDIEPVRDELEQIQPMPAAFDPNYAKRLTGDHVKAGLTRWQMVEATIILMTSAPPCRPTTVPVSPLRCAMPMPPSLKEHLSSWARPTPRWTSRPCGNWQH